MSIITEKLESIAMSLDEALKIVSPGDPFLGHMISALKIHAINNTEEDWQRLKAATVILRNRSKIRYAGPSLGYRVDHFAA